MKMQLIRLDQADQLSACRLSLLLGLNSDNDLVQRYVSFTTKLLNVKYAILSFEEEPYVWHINHDGLHALSKIELIPSLRAVHNMDVLDTVHPQYMHLCQVLQTLGVNYQRLIAINLQKSDQQSIGVAIFFDDELTSFDPTSIELVQSYTAGFVRHAELKFNFEELRELYEQQSALNFSKNKFFSIIAHDLRAPFHGLLGFSEVLAKERETLDESSVQNIADYLYDTSQSTYNLLESLLNWAMAEGGRFVYHPISFNLKQVTTIVMSILNTFALKKNIQLIDDVPEDIKLFADINMITSLIQNLVSNALKFTPMDGTGRVSISARQIAENVEIAVQDTGHGMTESQLKEVFQPRITVSFRGTAGEKGAGLGLTLCKRFVDLNLGSIKVESKEGEGTTFRVILPAAQHVTDNVIEHADTEVKLV